ncbi:restriction endonuclease [Varunaivibrio sulfuroxidans]|uniref:Restriction endonuclease n=1 Tax=Varunaivibrio sulfuroxidans TaxID=1773489 RepID=A0A4R3J714_9PROT|nr:restriction endonuclease [Varunaivibrio sulfuroxidans]
MEDEANTPDGTGENDGDLSVSQAADKLAGLLADSEDAAPEEAEGEATPDEDPKTDAPDDSDDEDDAPTDGDDQSDATPDEVLRAAHRKINVSLASDLLDRVREASPQFFEHLIVNLLLAMGYGGTSEDAARALGQSGDNGVDGVVDQDPLGVDQIYVQAKRYAEGNNIGAGDIRDFFGGITLRPRTLALRPDRPPKTLACASC